MIQPMKKERKKIVMEILQEENRIEDYPYLIESLSPDY